MSGNLGQRDDVTGADDLTRDDLTRIEGIGRRRAERLNAAGICSYAGLASRSRDEIGAVLPDIGPAKIDAWRDEARELAHAKATRTAGDAPAANGQPTADVRSASAGAHADPAGAQHERPAPSAVLSVGQAPLRAAEPFTLTMAIELAGPVSHADRLAYSAVVVAMPLTGGPKRTVARSDGILATTSSTISIDAAGLSPGVYRLDGAISLREPGAGRPVDLAGIAEGLLVQVLPG